jgi:elongation factor Ts
MSISINQINNLRKKTGAGILDCKKALLKSSGDFDKAIDIVRTMGKTFHDSNREVSEGSVFIKVNNDNNSALIMSLLCETDFVSNNPLFKKMGEDLASHLFFSFDNVKNTYDIKSTENLITKFTSRFKEKIKIGFCYKLSSELIISYLHNKGQIGVLLGLSGLKNHNKETLNSLRDVSMQIASMNPISIDVKDIKLSILEKEEKIIRETLEKQKNDKILNDKSILNKVVKGKLDKFIKDNTLLNQKFVKDNSKTVSDYLNSISKNISITSFKRLSI